MMDFPSKPRSDSDNNEEFSEGTGSGSGPQRSETLVSANDYYGSWGDRYILSLDGGGIKGYASLLIIDRLMRYVELEEQRLDREEHIESPVEVRDSPTNGYIGHDDIVEENIKVNLDEVQPRRDPCLYFDYIFGTSTGGLIAIMLGRLRMSTVDALEAYERLAGDIFGSQQWFNLQGLGRYLYDHTKLEEAIKQVVREAEEKELDRRDPNHRPWRPEGEQRVAGGAWNRESTFNSEPTKCRTVCVAYCDVAEQQGKPFLFRSYEHLPSSDFFWIDPDTGLPTNQPDNKTKVLRAFETNLNTGPAHSVPIWQVARATSAAPPFFAPMEIGGQIFFDGAVGCNNPALTAFQEVSLMHNGRKSSIKLLLSIGTGMKEVQRMGRGRLNMFGQLLKRAMGSLIETESTHADLERLSAFDKDHTGWYHRFNPPRQVGAMAMDRWIEGTEVQLRDFMRGYLDENEQGLRAVAAQLVDARRERARTRHYNMSATNIRWRCLVAECDNGQKVRNTEKELTLHIQKDHPAFLKSPDHLKRILDAGRIEH
jgi:Patatin-like phospholipase